MKQIGFDRSKTSYTELVGKTNPGISPKESFHWDYQRAVRVALIPWTNRIYGLRDILGYSTVGNAGGGDYVSRQPPAPYTDAPAQDTQQPYLWATGVDYEGYGVPTGGVMLGSGPANPVFNDVTVYQYARATITYEMLPFTILSDGQMTQAGYVDSHGNPDEATLTRYVEKEFKAGGRYLSVPKGTMKMVITGTPDAVTVGVAPGMIVPDADVRVTWKWVPSAGVPSFFVNPALSAGNPGAISTSLGCVNSTAFPPSADGEVGAGVFPPGSILLTAVAFVRHNSPTGFVVWDVSYFFQFAPNLHNYVPYLTGTNTFGWVELSTDGGSHAAGTTGYHIYNGAEFANLFRAP